MRFGKLMDNQTKTKTFPLCLHKFDQIRISIINQYVVSKKDLNKCIKSETFLAKEHFVKEIKTQFIE